MARTANDRALEHALRQRIERAAATIVPKVLGDMRRQMMFVLEDDTIRTECVAQITDTITTSLVEQCPDDKSKGMVRRLVRPIIEERVAALA